MACIGDYEVVRQTLNIPQGEPGASYELTLNAPSGKVVLSGGSAIGRGEPNSTGTAWIVRGNNSTGNATSVAVWATCARL